MINFNFEIRVCTTENTSLQNFKNMANPIEKKIIITVKKQQNIDFISLFSCYLVDKEMDSSFYMDFIHKLLVIHSLIEKF